MTMTPETEAAIERVRKLLALSRSNPNEHEAQAAAAKAMEILERYNLDVAMVDKEKASGGSERNDKKMGGGLYKWQRSLWEAVCKLCFCHYDPIKGLERGAAYQHRVIGSRANVISAELMAEYIQQTIERLAREWAKSQHLNIFAKDAVIYREGMATRIVERLNRLRGERLEADRKRKAEEETRKAHPAYAGSGNALVLADVIATEEDLNNDYLYGYEPGTHARRRKENEIRRAEYRAQYEEKERQDAQWRLENPEAAAKRDEEAAAQRARWEKEYARKERARERARERSGYYDRQYYKTNKDEERRSSPGFRAGYRKGDEVSLNEQVDREQRGAIK